LHLAVSAAGTAGSLTFQEEIMAALGASVCDDKGVMALPGERGCATSPRSYSISEKCLALRQGTSRTGRWF
jgi:hypothetical protein